MRISAVDNDIALFDEREEAFDEGVDWLASHYKKHDTTGFLKLQNEFLDGVGSLDVFIVFAVALVMPSFSIQGGMGTDKPFASLFINRSTFSTVRLKATTLNSL